MNAPPSTMQACTTPEPQKAAVFNVAEYKRQMALKQSPPAAKKDTAAKPPAAAATAVAAAPKAKPAAAADKPKSTSSAASSSEGVVDLTNPGTPMMKVEARFDFKGDASKHEMSFEKGDYITVYGKSHMEGWWVGRAQGSKETLYLPFNYVKLVKKFV